MILLFGGTCETAALAIRLAQTGHRVLVSTATELALETGRHEQIHRRCGRLDREGILLLIRREGILALVDAAHPFAAELHANARAAAAEAGIRYLRYSRPEMPDDAAAEFIRAADHHEAARLACAAGSPILLTTGCRNLEPYVAVARTGGADLFVRVLPGPESLAACRSAGIAADRIIAARGPFTVAQNRRLLRERGIRVLVSKESGAAGGLPEKLAAARAEHCRVVVVQRPAEQQAGVFADAEAIVRELGGRRNRRGSAPPP